MQHASFTLLGLSKWFECIIINHAKIARLVPRSLVGEADSAPSERKRTYNFLDYNFVNDFDNPRVISFSFILLMILLESNRSTGEMLSDALEGGMVQKYVYIVWSFWETILFSIYYCPCTLLNYVVYYTTHCSLDAQCSRLFRNFSWNFWKVIGTLCWILLL